MMTSFATSDVTSSLAFRSVTKAFMAQAISSIHEWDVPSTNVLGSIDKGNGQWADGYVSDTYHQNTAGHAEFMYAMVPSLFDAIKAGKPQPIRNQSKSMTVEAGKRIYFEPEETVHPFTITVRIKGTVGQVFSLTQAVSLQEATVRINEDGTVTYTAPSGSTITSTTKVSACRSSSLSALVMTRTVARSANCPSGVQA